MNPPRHGGSALEPRGFVLVGVVMFVLALTILGLSLFSLSSFEAQFLGASTRNTQSLHDAMSGVEWAKIVLARERRLQSVQNGEPAATSRPAGVTYVEAWQGNRNNGGISYASGEPVRIRAMAEDGRGISRMVEMQYRPLNPDTTYATIVDSWDNLVIPYEAGIVDVTPRRPQTYLNGAIRVRNDDAPDWRDAPGAMQDLGPNVPEPKVSGYISSQSAVAIAPARYEEPSGTSFPNVAYELLGADPARANFFKSPGALISIFDQFAPKTTLRISNTCVWLLNRGARFNGPVEVQAVGPNARLVIVAEGIRFGILPGDYAYNPPPHIGLWFFSSIHSPNVPIVLVSDSRVHIENLQQTKQTNRVNDLTIWASGVSVIGPEAGHTFQGFHDADTDAIIQELAGMGALPGNVGRGIPWEAVAGTWRELDPDNPS